MSAGFVPLRDHVLAMLGAEVIKIENPRADGDGNRHAGPFVN